MAEKKKIYLKDYTPPPYLVDSIDLRLELDPAATRVVADLRCRRNPAGGTDPAPLELNGEHLELVAVRLDGRRLEEGSFRHDGRILTIDPVPGDSFAVQVETIVNPRDNTALEGLYLSSGNYCTQCEAEGFRRITCFPDRPDVMSVFTTTIVADRATCPVLLSNGNPVDSGTLEDGRHWVTWHDPFPKPCYLFALVAGDLVRISDTFTTMGGREVALHIYVEERNRDKCGHAMESLKKAMRWDEERFGREYDLDIYMIVAVDDFNMGAMENKGLNIFNSKYVLARPETATDADYEGIEGVIGHEYFHNWTGNRITCRDWFQLSLKEGLTVFRDQEFSADMGSRPVKRIHDVNVIRTFQFREDAGPMAHPVRPDSFVEINNFYTLTVYNKGAEVIRMIHTLLGEEGFRRGMDLYFERHDGQAVTCDDFVRAMEDASGVDLAVFRRWYDQAGTPELAVEERYDAEAGELRLTLRQSCPPTPGQPRKQPFSIPVAVGLLDERGREIPFAVAGGGGGPDGRLLVLEQEEREFRLTGVTGRPALSLLRGFSAPVRVRRQVDEEELAFLMAHDTDPFNRWDAGQQLAMRHLLAGIDHLRRGGDVTVPELFVASYARLLGDRESDQAFLALAMTLPAENWIAQQMEVVDPDAIFVVRQAFRHDLGRLLRRDLLARYHDLASDAPYRYSAAEAGRRSLRNFCLAALLAVARNRRPDRDMLALGRGQYLEADNMTDRFAALAAVVNADRDLGDELLADFHDRFRDDPLVVDKWLMLQATCSLPGTLERVKELTGHPDFNLKNPNKVRSLIGAFCSSNQWQFHAVDGAGYRFLADHVLALDPVNPQIAARLLTPLTLWRRYDRQRRHLMREQLARIAARPDLSPDVAEIVGRSLDGE